MEVILPLSKKHAVTIGTVSSTVSNEIVLSVSSEEDELMECLKILGVLRDFIPKRYTSISDALGLHEHSVLRVMPNHVLRVQCEAVLEDLQNTLENSENEEYVASYLTIKRFLRSLSAAHVCQSTLDAVIENTKHPGTADRIKALRPNLDGHTKSVTYSMQKSATGRLTVTAGPQILTLPAESRRVFKSRFVNGKVLQLDLIAAEPKIALAIQGNADTTA